MNWIRRVLKKRTSTHTITLGAVLFLALLAYTLVLQNKVNATEELRQTQAKLTELRGLISWAQESYKIAEESLKECSESWNAQMTKAHNDAESYRAEINKLEGLLLNR